MDDLKKLRDDIDSIDRELIALFQKRMETVLKVAEYKKKNNIPILNANREDEVIKKNSKRIYNEDFKKPVEEFLKDIMKISKELQAKKISE
ncbi:chorismate mutase [Clostridium massiliodielmoense]|uniref:chorismate mutase n=1 Tax=Clostridium massiliodielmoense TaxID=1776385 RepID=UPI0004DACD28|nr:chorismate mutase [Clostridium massiliodielmoense]KEH98976.1 chorismate mutase [Clostridium botulinum C/D str. BKT12695]